MRGSLGVVTAAMGVVGVLASGCDDHIVEEEIQRRFVTNGAPRILVQTFNGSINVVPRRDTEVRVNVFKRAGGEDEDEARELLNDIRVLFDQEGEEIRIVASTSKDAEVYRGAALELAVPMDAQVNLQTDNDHICVTGVHGGTVARTTNGTIRGENVGGVVELHSSNGTIEVDASEAVVEAETSNGSVELKGVLAEGRHSLRTTNGGITVSLPDDTEFSVDARTTNGTVSSEFRVEGAWVGGREQLEGSVGDNPRIALDLSSTNGNIKLQQAD